MEPDYLSQRGLTLILLGLDVSFLLAAFISLLCWLTFGDWRPYLVQIAGIAWALSIPLTYLIWGQIEKRYRS